MHCLQGKRFISELSRVAEHSASSVFTVQQMKEIAKVCSRVFFLRVRKKVLRKVMHLIINEKRN